MNSTRNTASALLPLLGVALAACGGGDVHGVDTGDPRKVAEAIAKASYDCGEDGAGLIYDLTAKADRGISRAAFLEQQRRAGCRPTRVPDALETSEVGRRGDYVEYRFRPAISFDVASAYLPDDLTAEEEEDGVGVVLLVKSEDQWRFRPRQEGHL